MLAWLWTRLSNGGPAVTISGRALRHFPEREVERLLRTQALIEGPKADTWSVCAHCECGLDARPIREVGDELRACCPYDAAEDVVLEKDDLRRFSIEAERLADAIAASGGLTGGVAQIANGVWLIGTASMGCAVVLCCDPEILVAPGVILAIKAAAGGVPVTVIAATFDAAIALRLHEAGLQAQQLGDAIGVSSKGRTQLVLHRILQSAGGIRLALNRNTRSAVLDGRYLDLPTQMFVLFMMLAEQLTERDPVLHSQRIEMRLTREPREVVRDLRRALVTCGLSVKAAEGLIQTVRGRGYRLGLEAAEVAIEG